MLRKRAVEVPPDEVRRQLDATRVQTWDGVLGAVFPSEWFAAIFQGCVDAMHVGAVDEMVPNPLSQFGAATAPRLMSQMSRHRRWRRLIDDSDPLRSYRRRRARLSRLV